VSLHGMKALVAIAGREVRRRWMILPAALVVGFFPIVASRLGWKAAGDPVVGLFGCLSLGLVAALGTGYSVIGGEMAAGRLAFFFSRPVPWWAIWGGKLSASFLLTAVTGVLAAVPWMTARAGQPLSAAALMDLPGSLFATGLIVLAVGLAHTASIAHGSRSWLVAADLGLFAAWLWGLWAAGPLIVFGAMWVLFLDHPPYNYLQWPLALALLAASAVQVYVGRTDARRSHLALSATLWSLLFASLGLVSGVGWRLLQATPRDLADVLWAAAAPRGDWMYVVGHVRGRIGFWYAPLFLYEAESARFVRLGIAGQATPPAFSGDGKQAALLKVEDWGSEGWSGARLYLADLASDPPSLRAVPLGIPPMPKTAPTLAFCPDGDCLLLAQDEALTLYDLPSGKSRWSAPSLRGQWLEPVVFLDHALLRAYRRWSDGTTSTVEIVTLRLRDGSQQATGRLEAPKGAWLRSSTSGERLLVLRRRTPTGLPDAQSLSKATLHDGVTGALLATLAENLADVDADFLADGRIALTEISDGGARLRVLDRNGNEARSIDLGPSREASLGGEPEPGRLFVGLGPCPMFLAGPHGCETALVDLESGQITRKPGASPAHSLWQARVSPWGPRPAPGSLGAMLFRSDEGQLVRLDAKGGTRQVLLGGP
jgi:hypothetical protein